MENKWYDMSKEDLFIKTGSRDTGLTEIECYEKIKKQGKNELPKKKNDSFIKILISQFFDPIIILLIVSAFFSFLINELFDGLAIFLIIFIDLLLGTFQEWKASKNALALSNMIKVKVKVIRDNDETEIDSKDLVIGDIVLLESGNKISADMRIINSSNLLVDESILTGESVNVSKIDTPILGNISLSERKNMVYAGTSVITGRATCIVIATGIDTEIGKIADKVTNTKDTKSPLTIRMEKFSTQISILIVIVSIIITILLYFKGTNASEIFLSVIALSVSAMPEGLPLALTMALTIASNRMSKKNVIVKKLNSVESLGSCTVIASDKTGTLTVNEQTAKKILLPDNSFFDIDGTGYDINGNVISNGNMQDAYKICELGVINNEADVDLEKGEFIGDSIDVAFLILGKKMNVDISNIQIHGGIPYESENKYSAVFYNNRCTVKGSLEKILEFCDKMYVSGKKVPINKDLLLKQNEELASNGYRVISIADGNIENKDIKNLTFMGMVAFIDPVRIEVKEAINECKSAGIKVVMITGDHPLTAFAIAKELGIADDFDKVATGIEIEEKLKLGHEKFDEYIKNKQIFTRVTPMDKLEIVESYKRQGEFVAVTGDGVNDAPAIKSANIGVAMGSGTDVAKETSSMIVLDDNFKSIVSGIKEGRNAYSNIRKVSYMLLSCGMAEVMFFVLAIMFNYDMPLVAIQLLWLNIVTDGLQDFALSFEKAENGIMTEKPRSPKESLFNKSLFLEVFISGLVMCIAVFGVWVYLLDVVKMDVYVARGYIMVLMVFMQNMHVLNCRSEKQSVFKVSLLTNPLIIFSIITAILMQIIVSEVPILSTMLQTTSVPLPYMLLLFLISTSILFVMEIYKKIRYKAI